MLIPKERIRENGSEIDMFKKVYKSKLKEWKNFCVICNKELKEKDIKPHCFCHILPKWKYPQYRYFQNNIMLACSIEHHKKADEAVNRFKEEKGLVELEMIINSWEGVEFIT